MRPLRLALLGLAGLLSLPAAAAEPAGAAPPAKAPAPTVPGPAECKPLPALRTAPTFARGELLEFTLDALGAEAGKMTMRVLPPKDGTLPVEVHVQTNTFFSKVRRVNGVAMSYLHPRTLRPLRHTEDTVENEQPRTVNAVFGEKDRSVTVDYTQGRSKGHYDYHYLHDGLDVAGALYLLRQLPLQQGLSMCFDVYGVRRMWRMTGTVLKREHVSLPLGEFDAWHLTGTAVRIDKPEMRRDVHLWVTDDARRLPLAAVGTVDLGAVRATLTAVSRPGEAPKRAQGKEEMKW
ncbi:DUF3108 domain-containing protein [Aggregicoccus sp. 17bor-14]|uniref:DUF3108 domain-containing protein n=1 Tax=Myxococcaceae TaxID=31 RepID=UPI00129D02DA|nr:MULTISPECIES: DUF3108 domain-containing protein [Myxococcaceae]MBF5041456.1 DUF3108 domain-containing protein [Simulacricoccus sp. 17bor-14]MRI87240.1 DUF3108 domain-containing protein [Aggregicoccus sp. 17bor-14]